MPHHKYWDNDTMMISSQPETFFMDGMNKWIERLKKMCSRKWWLCWKISGQCIREINFFYSDIIFIIFTLSENDFIQLETILINHTSYFTLVEIHKNFPNSTFIVLNILLRISTYFPKFITFLMTIWSVQCSDALMHAGFKRQFELCWRSGKNICAYV